ncbi:unnamed protein product [Moneuplotes crassus]|uniref:AP2/ERF domain-containing protein n=1 Tax=Euplotes crassus TaxID=5936 RepID=A0AAD1UIS4_EUPCR|nr:unnamed protein product [Moneuplotes crassus]
MCAISRDNKSVLTNPANNYHGLHVESLTKTRSCSNNTQKLMIFRCSPKCWLLSTSEECYLKVKFILHNNKMNFLNFDNNVNSTPFSMWSYSDIVQELSSVYCMGHLSEQVQESQNYCALSAQECQTAPYPYADGVEPYVVASDAKTQLSFTSGQAMPEIKNLKTNKNLESKKRNCRSNKLDIAQQLVSLRWSILNNYVTGFTSSSKKAKSAHKKHLRRRSKYIGVSRNNANWQALINIDQIKRYIGTFGEELQAARAYDLYSVAMKGEEASLNFNYSSEEMLERIDYFLEHNSVKYD